MTILAELSSDSIASVTGSTISVIADAPVLALCRWLVDGSTFASSMPMSVYRGSTLCLKLRSIGEAAELRVTTTGHGPPAFKQGGR